MFMTPETVFDTFILFRDNMGNENLIQKEYINIIDGFEVIQEESGWFSRLSAAGYMDCTDWIGPFNTQEEALVELNNLYEFSDEDADA